MINKKIKNKKAEEKLKDNKGLEGKEGKKHEEEVKILEKQEDKKNIKSGKIDKEFQKLKKIELDINLGKRLRHKIFFLTYPNMILNQLTIEIILSQILNNFLAYINLKNKEFKGFKKKNNLSSSDLSDLSDFSKEKEQKEEIKEIELFNQLTEKEKEILFYGAIENYLKSNEKHSHLYIDFPIILNFQTQRNLQKIFGVVNFEGKLIIPDICPVRNTGYTYILQYLMKEDINPIFNFEPKFLLDLLERAPLDNFRNSEIKKQLRNKFLSLIYSKSSRSSDNIKEIKQIKEEIYKENLENLENKENSDYQIITNRTLEQLQKENKNKIDNVKYKFFNILKSLKPNDILIIISSKQDIINLIKDISLKTEKHILIIHNNQSFSYIDSFLPELPEKSFVFNSYNSYNEKNLKENLENLENYILFIENFDFSNSFNENNFLRNY